MTLQRLLRERSIIPFVGVYDVFSAKLAARYYDALFVSGFGYAASHYGLPDIGFVTWSDIVSFVQRLRNAVPNHYLLVDVDDGFCDPDVAVHCTRVLESLGASGIVLEDQARPRRCGHVNGKRLVPTEEYVNKLERVLDARDNLFVVARTDASDPREIRRRVEAYSAAGADAILVDGMADLSLHAALSAYIPQPLVFNQLTGGKSPSYSLAEMERAGISIAIYSTPCLFAAQKAVEDSLLSLKRSNGRLPERSADAVGVGDCNEVLMTPSAAAPGLIPSLHARGMPD